MTPRTLADVQGSRVAAPSLPSMSDEVRWSHPDMLPSINRGDHLSWEDVKSPFYHQLVHPVPQQDCDLCPQSEACACGMPSPECLDLFECRRRHGGAEQTWREAAAR